MKIVLDHKNFDRFGDAKYSVVNEFGFDGVAFSMCPTTELWYTAPIEESDAYLTKERERAEREGVKFLNCHGPWKVPWPDVTEEGLREKVEFTKRTIHNTRVLGAKYCVVHPFLPMDMYEKDDPEKSEITWKTNIAVLKELLQVARKEDVVLCFENMPMLPFSLAKPRDIMRVVKEINDDHLKVCLDTGHANIYNELTITDSLNVVKDDMRVMHVHDNFYNVDMHLFPFLGNTNWTEFSQALKDIDYQYIFEPELDVSTRLDLELSRDALRIIKDTCDFLINPEKFQ